MNIEVFNKTVSINRALVMSTGSLICAVLLGFSALIKIPIPGSPVPATLQTFTLLLCAGMLGRWYSVQMVGWYLILGLVGAPFFAKGSGLQYVFGATGGYLWGFFLASFIVGFLHKKSSGLINSVAIYVAAALAIYIPGILQLKLVTGSTWQMTLAMGLYPFIMVDLIKAVIASQARRVSRLII
ncbi:MAG: biotin transporter BioY [Deltaproteobacteria bacterium]|jgi:biotin transport system substrate-specific component|nr:biotin transporter BioY [Deltaproteobacteria bacterium]